MIPPGPERCEGVARHWLYGHAQRLSGSFADGAGGIEARSALMCRPRLVAELSWRQP